MRCVRFLSFRSLSARHRGKHSSRNKGSSVGSDVLCLKKKTKRSWNKIIFFKQERLRGYVGEPLAGLLCLSCLSQLRSGVNIFVHPADSSAQPSAQAASLLIGPIWRN